MVFLLKGGRAGRFLVTDCTAYYPEGLPYMLRVVLLIRNMRTAPIDDKEKKEDAYEHIK